MHKARRQSIAHALEGVRVGVGYGLGMGWVWAGAEGGSVPSARQQNLVKMGELVSGANFEPLLGAFVHRLPLIVVGLSLVPQQRKRRCPSPCPDRLQRARNGG